MRACTVHARIEKPLDGDVRRRHRRREAADRMTGETHVFGRAGRQHLQALAGLGDDVLDQGGDQRPHQFVRRTGGI